MSLGLYVSSFYFFQSGKQKSNYLGLNSPIRYEDTHYSKAMDFFEDFFVAHHLIEDLESEKKLYSIETNPAWSGETEKYAYTAACIRSGGYGVESEIYDVESLQKVGSIEKNQAGVIPFFVFVAIPKEGTSTGGNNPIEDSKTNFVSRIMACQPKGSSADAPLVKNTWMDMDLSVYNFGWANDSYPVKVSKILIDFRNMKIRFDVAE